MVLLAVTKLASGWMRDACLRMVSGWLADGWWVASGCLADA